MGNCVRTSATRVRNHPLCAVFFDEERQFLERLIDRPEYHWKVIGIEIEL